MQILLNILFWLGIAALVDGSLGLLYLEKWQKMTTKWDLQKIAWIEISIAWSMLAAHFILRFRGGA
jgi:hypothetical protein